MQEESIVGQVLAELGVEEMDKMAVAPTKAAAASVDVSAGEGTAAAAGDEGGGGGGDDLDAELQKRLENLRRT